MMMMMMRKVKKKLLLDMYLHQMVYPRGFNHQMVNYLLRSYAVSLVPVCKNQTQTCSDFGSGSRTGTGTGIF